MTNPEELYRRHSAAFDKLHASEKEDERKNMKRFRIAKTVYYDTIVWAEDLKVAKARARQLDWTSCVVGESVRVEEDRECDAISATEK